MPGGILASAAVLVLPFTRVLSIRQEGPNGSVTAAQFAAEGARPVPSRAAALGVSMSMSTAIPWGIAGASVPGAAGAAGQHAMTGRQTGELAEVLNVMAEASLLLGRSAGLTDETETGLLACRLSPDPGDVSALPAEIDSCLPPWPLAPDSSIWRGVRRGRASLRETPAPALALGGRLGACPLVPIGLCPPPGSAVGGRGRPPKGSGRKGVPCWLDPSSELR